MRLDAITHIPMSEYAYGLDEKHIVYRLKASKGDLIKVTLYYGDTACMVNPIIFTKEDMSIIASDKLFDYWQVIVNSKYERVYYYFDLYSNDDHYYYYGFDFKKELDDERSHYFKLPFNHRADIAKIPDWVSDAIVYNIFPDSFASSKEELVLSNEKHYFEGNILKSRLGGTIKGIISNIDYLTTLGINCVYINPIFTAGEYHKYDLLDYYHIDPCFGTNEDFMHLVKLLHSNGIKIIIDGVFNHCSWHFFAFDDVIKNQEQSAFVKWFYDLKFPVKRPIDGELPTYSTFAYEKMMPKLATDNEEVEKYFCEVGKYWVKEFDIDGWRLDVASEVNSSFWRAFRKAIKGVKEDAILIGEVWESANYWLQGDMFDSTMNYDFRKYCEAFFAKKQIDALEFSSNVVNMLMRYKLNVLPAQLNLLDSHDVSRFLSLCNNSIQTFKLAVVFMMTFIGMPTVFYGDEMGIVGVCESQFRQAMPWEQKNVILFSFFQKIINIRKEYVSLRRGDFSFIKASKNEKIIEYSRCYNNENVVVCMNVEDKNYLIKELPSRIIYSEGLSDNILHSNGFYIGIK